MEYFDVLDGVVKEKSRVAFGFFDGMHLGHRAVIDKLVGYEAQVPVVLSFQEKEDPVIYNEHEKEYLLKDSGISYLISMPATDVRNMKAETFVKDVLVEKLRAASVVVGENLVFGSDDKGVQDLIEYGKTYGFTVDVVPVVKVDGEVVTTDAIKEALTAGDFPKMQKLLGHTYVMIGKVAHGKAEGRQHGMPTANLAVSHNKLFPPHGVYATLSKFDGTFYRGMTNVGLRPSADTIPIPTIETWLLNFARDIYGKKVVLELHVYIRGVMKFAGGLDEVRKQIDKDLANINDSIDELIAGMKK